VKELQDLPRGKVTELPTKVRRSYPFDVRGNGECLIDRWGQRHCNHDHPEADPQLQDVYEYVPGWTAQS
jgi:hypothetical protein